MPKKNIDSSERHILSKTSFIKSIQCQKQVFLYKNRFFLHDKLTPEKLAIYKRGHKVGKLAWELFPNGIDVSPKSPMLYDKALIQTQNLIKLGQRVLYEASFRFNQCLCILDMLICENSQINAYEVKSSLSITETYLYDAAFQYYVMSGAGFIPEHFYLVYVNSNYVLENHFSASEYFIIEEVTSQLIALQPIISAKVEEAKSTIQLSKTPTISIGLHCEKPYQCDFLGFCRKYIPSSNVFSLTDLSSEEKYQLYGQGKVKLENIHTDEIESFIAKLQLYSHKNLKEIIENSNLVEKEFQVGYFIWDSPAIPIIEGHKPYTPLLMAYFWKNATDINSQISSIILKKEEDYSYFLKKARNIISEKSIITYDSSNCNLLLDINNQFTSLYSWLKEKKYYHPDLNGDYSLEKISEILYGKDGLENNPLIQKTKNTIFHHETMKTAIISAFENKDELCNEAFEFASKEVYKIEKVWKSIMKKRQNAI